MTSALHQNTFIYTDFDKLFANFQAYVDHVKNELRSNVSHRNAHELEMISPYEWKPDNSFPKKGVLLIHGLLDTPFVMQDLASFFIRQNMVVRNVLLPGHGSSPGNLLDIKYDEWMKCLEFALKDFPADEVYVAGFSLGGLLATQLALNHPNIAGLMLFAPAFKMRPFLSFALNWHKVFSWAYPKAKWFTYHKENDFAKYESIAFNAIHQIYLLGKKVRKQLKKTGLPVPTFMMLTEDDEAIRTDVALDIFKQQKFSNSHCIVYGNSYHYQATDPRIQHTSSLLPNESILGFSHVCMISSPENPHYGRNGDYIYDLHYKGKHDRSIFKMSKVHFGSLHHSKKHFPLKRLTYNPYFSNVCQNLYNFVFDPQDTLDIKTT